MKKSYQFQFSSNAERYFSILEKPLQRRILVKLDFFERAENPLSFAKKLGGLENRFRFRIGDYRVIVAAKDQNTFVILLILKSRSSSGNIRIKRGSSAYAEKSL